MIKARTTFTLFPPQAQNMRAKGFLALAGFGLAVICNATSESDQIRLLGPQGVNLWKLDNHPKTQSLFVSQDAPQQPLKDKKPSKFRAQWFEQPLDHFDKNSKHTFHQRYWVSTRHYRPRKGAPVIVLDGGETSGTVSIALFQFMPIHIVD